MKYIYTFLLVLLVSNFVSGQEPLQTSKNFNEAVQSDTRTLIGKPGEKYWQNTADYNITATVNPTEKTLIGYETITYKNNIPIVLKKIVLHLFQNLYKKGAARGAFVNPDDITDGVVINTLLINNKAVKNHQIIGTQLIITLEKPLKSQENSTIAIGWKFRIPMKSNIRMGGKDATSFFLGQWYPKVAVFDDIKGWDRNRHSGNQEFYSDLGTYNYKIKVPKGYVIWGTGTLKNAKHVLNSKIYNRFKKAHKSNKVISIINSDDYQKKQVTTNNSIWEFSAKNIPDIAFGMSDHFLWDATSLKGVNGNRIFVSAAYPKESKDFTEVAHLAKKSIQYMSTKTPGYPYPYPAMTIFNGTNSTSGMEYCMIVNDPSADNRGRTVDVTAHEIAHNYMPFFVLTNETEHGWMDEAFAAMMPHKYQKENAPESNRITRYAKEMSEYAATDRNLPVLTNSVMQRGSTSSFNVYKKPAVGLWILEDLLGEKLFNRSLKNYIKDWKGKHPMPYDFFNSINTTTGKNYNWFWKKWFFQSAYPDLGIHKVVGNKIYIQKTGGLPVPVILTITYDDNTNEKLKYKADVWKNNTEHIVIVSSKNKIIEIELGNDYIPDTNTKDNHWKTDK